MKENQISKTLNMLPVSLLTIAFVVLKLCKVIDWSWWWVLSPLWIIFALIILISAVVYVIIKRKVKREGIHESVEANPNLKKKMEEIQQKLEEIQKNRAKV